MEHIDPKITKYCLIIYIFYNFSMTKNNFKVILFAALVAAMILPVSGMNYAEAQPLQEREGEMVEIKNPAEKLKQTSKSYDTATALEMVTPYITINKDKTVKIDVKSAVENKIPKAAIVEAIKIIKQQNELVRGERVNVEGMPSEFKSETEMASASSGSARSTASASVCNWAAQTEAPNRPTYPTYQSTLAASKAWLLGIGYHNVAGYALHPNAWDNPAIAERDFQLSVSAHGCEPGVFRAEAYLHSNNAYGYSSPEPNPEYLDTSYTWPVWYWPGYVVSWHSTH